ncbi:MAG: hypothetical protein WCJ61_12570 [Paludibacter sp.]
MSFSTDFKKGAGAYLYIFIAHDANMGDAIMTKRANQIINLDAISKLPGTPNFNQLVEIVRAGIIERYGMTPNEVLSKIYHLATTSPAVGSPETDAAKAKALAEMTVLANDSTTGAKKETNFWDDVKSIIEWIIQQLNALGIVKAKSKEETTPISTDWGKIPTDSNISSAGMGTYLPYIFGAAIVYTLFTNGTKKSK